MRGNALSVASNTYVTTSKLSRQSTSTPPVSSSSSSSSSPPPPPPPIAPVESVVANLWEDAYSSAVKATVALKSGQKTALKILHLQTKFSKIPPTREVITTVFKYFAKKSKFTVDLTVEDAQLFDELFDHLRVISGIEIEEVEIANYLQIVSYRQDSDSVARIRAIINSLLEDGYQKSPFRVFYSILLKVMGRVKDAKGVNEVVSEMESRRIPPDGILLNSLISAYTKCDLFDLAFITLKKMESVSLANINSYNALMTGYRDSDTISFEQIFELGQRILNKGLEFDHITYSIMVDSALRSDEVYYAESLLREVEVKIRGNTKTRHNEFVECFTVMLSYYARQTKGGGLKTCMELLEKMKSLSIAPNRITYTSLITSLASVGRVTEAKQVFAFMKGDPKVKPGVITYNALMTGLISQSTVKDDVLEEVTFLYSNMRKSGIKPNIVTMNVLIKGLCLLSRVSDARSLIEEMESKGGNRPSHQIPKPDVTTFSTLIASCKNYNDGNFAAQFALDTLKEKGWVDLIVVNVFIGVCVSDLNVFKVREALKCYEEFCGGKKSLVAPDSKTFELLITALLRISNKSGLTLARKLYSNMPQQLVTKPFVTTLISAAVDATSRSTTDREALTNLIFDIVKENGDLDQKVLVRDLFVPTVSEVWKGEGAVKGLRAMGVESVGDKVSRRREIEIDQDKVKPLFKRLFSDYESDEGADEKSDDKTVLGRWNAVDSGFKLW